MTLKAWLSDKKKKVYERNFVLGRGRIYFFRKTIFFNEWEEWKEFQVTAQPSSITTKSWFAQPLLEWLKKTEVWWESNKNRFYSGNIAIMWTRPQCGTCSIPNKTKIKWEFTSKEQGGGHACVLSRFSRVGVFVTLWTVVHQAPLSMGFSRQECWSGLSFPPPGDLPKPGIQPLFPAYR